MDPKIIDDLAKKVADSMPESLRNLQNDVEQNFKATLQAGLGRLDLVTRDEFDVQANVLRRTRQKLRKHHRMLRIVRIGTGQGRVPFDKAQRVLARADEHGIDADMVAVQAVARSMLSWARGLGGHPDARAPER